MKAHHVIGFAFLVVLLLILVGSCVSGSGSTYYHLPGTSYGKTDKHKAPKYNTYKRR